MMNTLTGIIKYIGIVSVCVLLLAFLRPPKSIYSIQLKDIDGTKIELVKFREKKMVFIVISGKETDSAFNELSDFCGRYKDSTAIFGVLSIEDGYNNTNKESVKSVFNSRCPGLTLTEGMHIRKISAEQSELMQWFSNADQNLFLNNDITGAGWKFFVDETGRLYAGLGKHALLTSPFIQRVMNSPPRRPGAAPASSPGASRN